MPATSDLLRGLAGALAGGAIGYVLFAWLWHQGIYALALPMAAVGIGCGALLRSRTPLMGIVCLLLALMLGIFAEWRHAPFRADPSLTYFLSHLHRLSGATMLMLLLGSAIAVWSGMGQPRQASRASVASDRRSS